MEKVVPVFDNFEEADNADALFRSRLTPSQRVDIFLKFGKERETIPLSRDLKEFVGLLNSNRAEYLIEIHSAGASVMRDQANGKWLP